MPVRSVASPTPEAIQARRGPDPRRISVVTPTFNRADLLERLARSISAQREHIREWVVVDDGSTDDTAQRVREMRPWLGVGLTYHYQLNAGRMAAVNRGIQLATGELVASMDSDDWFADRSLGEVVDAWLGIPAGQRRRYAGVVALCMDELGRPLGHGSPPTSAVETDLVTLAERHSSLGDRKEFLRRDVLLEHPYPIVPGERRVATSTIWPAISERYTVRLVPVAVVHKTYLPDGLTRNIDRMRAMSPVSSAQRYRNYLAYRGELSRAAAARNAVNYVRYCLHAGQPPSIDALPLQRRLVVCAASPLGAGIFVLDRLRLRLSGR